MRYRHNGEWHSGFPVKIEKVDALDFEGGFPRCRVRCVNENEIREWDAVLESWGFNIVTDFLDESVSWEVKEIL